MVDTSELYEIIELANGEFALRRADEQEEPLVYIRFSEQSAGWLSDARVDVAKVMIEAGLEAVSELEAFAEMEALAPEASLALH